MHKGLSYNHQTVSLDAGDFRDCEFSNCRLIYSGGPLPRTDNCRFTDCEWALQGPAADTLAFLKIMWSVGAKSDVQEAIKEITATTGK